MASILLCTEKGLVRMARRFPELFSMDPEDVFCRLIHLKVRPFFESKWWASTFTNLTEKRKRAEDSENDGAVELANEASRNFFKNLTVMQEIWAEQRGNGRRRMGILLWRFSQATPPYVGTTTWQRLIPASWSLC